MDLASHCEFLPIRCSVIFAIVSGADDGFRPFDNWEPCVDLWVRYGGNIFRKKGASVSSNGPVTALTG
jgi:hypothetical protein